MKGCVDTCFDPRHWTSQLSYTCVYDHVFFSTVLRLFFILTFLIFRRDAIRRRRSFSERRCFVSIIFRTIHWMNILIMCRLITKSIFIKNLKIWVELWNWKSLFREFDRKIKFWNFENFCKWRKNSKKNSRYVFVPTNRALKKRPSVSCVVVRLEKAKLLIISFSLRIDKWHYYSFNCHAITPPFLYFFFFNNLNRDFGK